MLEALLISNIVLWLAVVVARRGRGGAGAPDRRAARARRAGGRAGRRATGRASASAAPRFELHGLVGAAVSRSAAPIAEGRQHAAGLRLADLSGVQDAAADRSTSVLRSERRPRAPGARQRRAARRARGVRRARTAWPSARYVLSTELGLAYQVGKLPYAVLIDARRRAARQGTGQHARAPREPVRGDGARRRLGAGVSAARGGSAARRRSMSA